MVVEVIGKTVFHITHTPFDVHLLFTDGTALVVYDPHFGASAAGEIVLDAVEGDLHDLMDQPIVRAEETSNGGRVSGNEATWTRHAFSTTKGTVCFRWLGADAGGTTEQPSVRRGTVDLSSFPEYAQHLARTQQAVLIQAVGDQSAGPGMARKM